jgi:hypothetical protein
MADDTEELIRLTRELDTAMIEGMTKYNLSPLSISAVILARLTFLNSVTRGMDGLHDYYELLERHSEHVYRQWETQLDLDDIHEEWLANDNQKSADIIQFPRKDND